VQNAPLEEDTPKTTNLTVNSILKEQSWGGLRLVKL
jgi:hypothetical protein